MSTVIFGDTPGTVAVLKTGKAMPGQVTLGPNAGVFSAGKVVITGLGLSQATRVQMQQTLGDALYVTTFADRPGDVQISGLGFSTRCDGVNETNGGSHGIEDVLEYYDANKASEWKDGGLNIITVSIGTYGLKGLLMGSQIRMDSPAMGMYQFTLTISSLPTARNKQ
jgi:hypothetical protein